MSGGHDDDAALVADLRAGKADALAELLRRYHRATIRVARTYVATDACAEEVAQEAWLGVVQGIGSFEGRSSFRSWLFSIVANIAKRRGKREARSVPFSALGEGEEEAGPTVDPSRFLDDGRWAGHWAQPPGRMPDEQLQDHQVRALIQRAIDDLPPLQRRVILLRDVEGVSAEEACAVLEITEANQRVLLHRARAKVRVAVEALLEKGAS
ncbi:MAG: sigma-70 family RNA polymerase sigma factor [Minicystis sp.]